MWSAFPKLDCVIEAVLLPEAESRWCVGVEHVAHPDSGKGASIRSVSLL